MQQFPIAAQLTGIIPQPNNAWSKPASIIVLRFVIRQQSCHQSISILPCLTEIKPPYSQVRFHSGDEVQFRLQVLNRIC